jgi:hypothetical protein
MHALGVLKVELTGNQLDQAENMGPGDLMDVGQRRGAGAQHGSAHLCSVLLLVGPPCFSCETPVIATPHITTTADWLGERMAQR